MKKPGRFILILILIVAGAAAGFWFGRHTGGEHAAAGEGEAATTQASEESHPLIPVVVAPARRASIAEISRAFGSVVALSQEVRVVSVPFESRVGRILVSPGQEVAADTELVQLDASPDTVVALAEAENAVEAADRDLKQTEQRFASRLATNQELSAAQQAQKSATLKRNSLAERGGGKSQHLTAGVGGVVNKVNVEQGQIIPAGGAVVEIVGGNRVEVAVGVNPEDAPHLKVGQVVKLTQIGGSSDEPLEGHIRLIEQRVDPTTRQINVMVTPPPEAKLVLSTFIAAEMTREETTALLVPREAALPQEGPEFTVYTVQDGHAKKHSVRVGIEDDRNAQVIGDDIKENDLVVVQGNFELEDGMEVELTKRTATAPSSQAEAKP